MKTPSNRKNPTRQHSSTATKPSSQVRQPTMDAIRTLVAFVDSDGSVSEAARRLGSHQPVVSIKLKSFQTSATTGAILLQRSPAGRGLVLTDAGESVLPTMRELVRQYDQMMAHLSGIAECPRQIRVAAGAFSAEFLLPRALACLKDSAQLDPSSEISIRTNVMRGRDRILGVASGSFDIAIVSYSQEQVRETLREANEPENAVVCSPLVSLPMIVAAGRGTAAATDLETTSAAEPIRLETLRQWTLVGPDRQSGIRRRLEQALKSQDTLTFATEGGGWTAAREFARHGIGVAIIPQVIITGPDIDHFVCRNLDRRFVLEELLIQRGSKLPQTLRPVIEALSQATRHLSRHHVPPSIAARTRRGHS